MRRMRKRDKAQFQAKVTDDNGLTRGRVPCPLLNAMGARPGDYMIFRLRDSGEAVMRITRSRRKTGTGSSEKAASGKRR
jgi:hypothetical protein